MPSPINHDLIFRRILKVIWITLGPALAVAYAMHAVLTLIGIAIGFFCVLPWCIWQSRKSDLFFTKITLIIYVNCMVWCADAGSHTNVFTEAYLLPAALASLLIFKPKEVMGMATGFILPFFVWLAMDFVKPTWVPPGWIIDNPYPVTTTLVNIATAMALSILYFRLFSIAHLNLHSELEQSLTWKRAMLDASPYAIISTQLDGTVTTFNVGAEKLLGYTAEEVVGKTTPVLWEDPDTLVLRAKDLSQKYAEAVVADFNCLVKILGKHPGEVDISIRTFMRKNGTRFQVRICASAMRDESGNLLGYLAIAEDLTSFLEMENTIESQRQQIIKSARFTTLGQLLGHIAHEINNPLAVIKARCSLLSFTLEDGSFDPVAAQADLNKVEKMTDHVARVVRGLRMASRGDTDKMVVRTAAQTVEDAIDICASRLSRSGIRLDLYLDSTVKIQCQPAQISQVVINLVTNAADAIQSQSDKWITIQTKKSGDRAQISVTDSGTGIPDEVLSKIMEPFYTTKEVGHGTGLGLPIAQGIAKRHKGTLSYDRCSPHTRFVLDLPLSQEDSVARMRETGGEVSGGNR